MYIEFLEQLHKSKWSFLLCAYYTELLTTSIMCVSVD